MRLIAPGGERMATTVPKVRSETLRTLPDDSVRQILWHFADRYDLQMLVQSAREVARGPVARLVSEGTRGTHEWTSKKAKLLEAFDQSGIPALSAIHELGKPEQRAHSRARAAPPAPGEDPHPYRGAFCPPEPIPYVGVD